MFCPRCGNQPASDRMRFCASCGFRLDGVIELLANEGAPTNPLAPLQSTQPSPRKRGIRFGAKLLFFSVVLFLPVFAFAVGVADHPGPLILPGTLFLASLFWMLYYWLFGEESGPVQKQPQFISHTTPQPVYLPPPRSVPVTSHAQTPQPQSVAEHTTRSLGQQ